MMTSYERQLKEDIISKVITKATCGEEMKMLEDLHQVDAQTAFADIVAEDLGYEGMRLDLFYPDVDFQYTSEAES